ncbi:MAG: PAS domain S-box protein [Verrucomicrobia bacterium]|nr:PAS domain S-box protein [Prolixibacteraceae bacterium]
MDTNKINHQLLSEILEPEGYLVSVADNYQGVFQILEKGHPQLFLLNALMPDTAAYEVCRRLKAKEDTAEIPIIFMGAQNDRKSMMAAYGAGGSEYISIPFCKEEIRTKVKSLISLYQKISELKVRNKALEDKITSIETIELNQQKETGALTPSMHDSGEIVRNEISHNGKIRYDKEGKFKSTPCQVTEITQSKQSEAALEESEYKFRSLFENSSVGITITTIDGFIVANKAFTEMLGYSDKELQHKNWREISYPDDIQKNNDVLDLLIKGESSSARFEKRYIHKNGNIIWADINITLQRDNNDKPSYYITSINDITKRKHAEEALRESEERYHAFVNANADMIFVKDDQFRYLMANDAMASFFNKTKEELINKTDKELADDRHIYPCNSSDLKVLELDAAYTIEEKLGNRIYETTKFPLQLSGGKKGIGGIIRDISESKISADLIKNERQLLRTVIDNLPVTIYVKDREGRKIIANKADLEVIGFVSEAEVIGKTDLEIFDNEIGKRCYEDDLRVIQTGQPVINREEVFSTKNGTQQWLLTSKIPLHDQQGNISGLVGLGRDITEQKKANETIHKFLKSIEQSPSTIVITDVHGNIEYANPKFTDITGYTLDEVIGKNPRILKSGEMPPETYRQLWETISTGEVWRGEFLNKRKNGELYWEWATMTSIKNEEGTITNYISIKEDISSRKKMEADLIIAKEKAEENDRLKSAFLANMSHEIRTPLNSIIGFSELLSDPDFESDQRYEFARIITNSGNNLLSIISDILDISKIEAGQVEIHKSVFSVKRLIQDIHNEYKIKAQTKGLEIHIPKDFPFDELLIESDQTKVKQVLINFIGNALKFTEKGSIEIGVKVIGRSVQFHVKDTGIGIPEQYHARIFERFRQVEGSYTRKYGGNGLGLAISKSLIEMLGGTMGMKSSEGMGSLFYFTLPDVLTQGPTQA